MSGAVLKLPDCACAQLSAACWKAFFLGLHFLSHGPQPRGDRSVAGGRCLLVLNYFAWQASSLNRSLNRRLGVVP